MYTMTCANYQVFPLNSAQAEQAGMLSGVEVAERDESFA